MADIIFFGSAPISRVVQKRLIDNKVNISTVVTKPDKPVGRHLKITPNPVKVLALESKISVVESLPKLEVANGSVGLVAAYGKIIPQSVIDKFNGQIFNIHPSLLPKYRGPSPLQQQILDGLTETGVTIIQVDAGMDHGPILAQEKDEIEGDDTWVTLGERLFGKGAELFIDYLNNPTNYSLTSQDHSQASYTKLLTRQDGFVPWEEFQAIVSVDSKDQEVPHELALKFQAFYQWPGVWSVNPAGQRAKLLSVHPLQVKMGLS